MDFVEEDMTVEQRALLLQVYTIERQDNQTSVIVAFAIVAAALTYLVASTAFLVGHCSNSGCNGVPQWVQLSSPLIPLALLSFLVLNLVATIMRAKHVKKLEELLELQTKDGILLPSFHRDSSDIYEPKSRGVLRFIYPPLTFTTYTSVFLIAIVFTYVALKPGAWPWYKLVISVIYLGVFLLQLFGVVLALFHPRFKTEFIHDGAKLSPKT